MCIQYDYDQIMARYLACMPCAWVRGDREACSSMIASAAALSLSARWACAPDKYCACSGIEGWTPSIPVPATTARAMCFSTSWDYKHNRYDARIYQYWTISHLRLGSEIRLSEPRYILLMCFQLCIMLIFLPWDLSEVWQVSVEVLFRRQIHILVCWSVAWTLCWSTSSVWPILDSLKLYCAPPMYINIGLNNTQFMNFRCIVTIYNMPAQQLL